MHSIFLVVTVSSIYYSFLVLPTVVLFLFTLCLLGQRVKNYPPEIRIHHRFVLYFCLFENACLVIP